MIDILVERCSGCSVVRIELAIDISIVVAVLYQGFLTVRSLKIDLDEAQIDLSRSEL